MSTDMTALETVNSTVPAMSEDMFAADAADGVNFVSADLAIPFISLLQSLSPQCKKGSAKYIKGAEEGMLYNTVSKKVYPGDVGVEIIQGAYSKVFIEWKPRSIGGGFVAVHQPSDPIINTTTRNEKNEAILPNGNELKETAQYYVLVKDPETGDYEQAMLSLTKSNLKVSRTWNSLTNSLKMKNADGKTFTPAVYAYRYQLTSAYQSKGEDSWYTFKIEPVGRINDYATYEAAKAFSNAVRSGAVQVNQAAVVDAEDVSDSNDLPF